MVLMTVPCREAQMKGGPQESSIRQMKKTAGRCSRTGGESRGQVVQQSHYLQLQALVVLGSAGQ